MPTARSLFAGMSIGTRFVFLIPIIVIAWTILIGGTVTELPFGSQTAINAFAYIVHQIIEVLPWLEIIYDLMIAAIQIKILLMIVELFKWVLSIYLT